MPIQVKDPAGVGVLSGIKAIGVGNDFSCALSEAGKVYCWGGNNIGQLGSGGGPNQSLPVLVQGLSDIQEIAIGRSHACALSDGGQVYCWGSNDFGALGNGSFLTSEFEPVEVKDPIGLGVLTDIIKIAAGVAHTCALDSEGKAYCWGANSYGAIGNGGVDMTRVTLPERVVGLGGVGELSDLVQIGGGHHFSCALKSEGSVYCWGINQDGQLGNNGEPADAGVPVQVKGPDGIGYLSDIRELTFGKNHVCALNGADEAYCWGGNEFGQIGSLEAHSKVPIRF